MIEPRTLKGFRDFLPKDARKRQYVISTLRKVFELYGFEPLETPALEYEEVLLGKYGDEGDKLMYRFEDNGGRRVAMRYDQTVPLARVVAERQNELPFPFKRYQIQPVWRAENPQKGRFREFLQCDIDTVGTASNAADAEIVAITIKAVEALGFKNFTVLLNDRKLFAGMSAKTIITIDKLKKIGEDAVIQELVNKSLAKDTTEAKTMLERLKNAKPTQDLIKVMEFLQEQNIPQERFSFSPSLARGLDYYTGLIFEIELEGYEVGSVCGGGRYDNLIGMFMKGANLSADRQVPAVGCAFGFDRILEAMDQFSLFPDSLQAGKVLVTIFSLELAPNAIQTAAKLREQGINTELWLDIGSKMEKQLKYANQKEIPYTIIIGPDEVDKNVVTLRNMNTREQRQLSLDQLPDALR